MNDEPLLSTNSRQAFCVPGTKVERPNMQLNVALTSMRMSW